MPYATISTPTAAPALHLKLQSGPTMINQPAANNLPTCRAAGAPHATTDGRREGNSFVLNALLEWSMHEKTDKVDFSQNALRAHIRCGADLGSYTSANHVTCGADVHFRVALRFRHDIGIMRRDPNQGLNTHLISMTGFRVRKRLSTLWRIFRLIYGGKGARMSSISSHFTLGCVAWQ